MKSNVCKIDKGIKDLDAILKECEKVAVYNELTHKQALQLRLLCEEIDGMLPKIVDDFDGALWIDFEGNVCKVNVCIELADMTIDKKDELIAMAKNKKNAAAVGIVGKISCAIDDFLLAEEAVQTYTMASESFQMATGYNEGVNYEYLWSLEQYKKRISQDQQQEAWDELEKSVIASVADDVVVGVKGRQVNIVVIKHFA